MPKYIFVTGGVVSSLGKGIASASIGRLLESRGLKITFIKCDPYVNVDPGTMSPYQHGEVYVTDDGTETDLDLGHYERFTTVTVGKENNITTGKVYYSVITKERRGGYLGNTVQVVPHITDEIKSYFRGVSKRKKLDVVIIELGGTVGDIESLPFLEAIRQFILEEGPGNAINIHLTLLPYIKTSGEVKTKPTQHSVGRLREIGIQPDILLCRSEMPFSREAKKKIALFCNVRRDSVIQALDVENIYEVPTVLGKEGLDKLILRLFRIRGKRRDMARWHGDVLTRMGSISDELTVAIVGKYVALQDAYKSICEALVHGGIANDIRVHIRRVDSEEIAGGKLLRHLKGVCGILVPGGFGYRGIEGKIKVIRYARENKIPFLGICLGMQLAVVEFARHVCGLREANSTEFDKNTVYPVISLLPGQRVIKNKGGTMRLGAYPCRLRKETKSFEVYKKHIISERHRHRYEFNNEYKGLLKSNGLVISGTCPRKNLVEIVELKDHPWFVACQFHPEFKSKPDKTHPLFRGFIKASAEFKKT